MPKLTLVAGTAQSIPAATDLGAEAVNGGLRKTLIISLKSGDAVMGYNADITLTGANDCGVDMDVGSKIVLMADDLRLTKPIYFLTSGGGVVTWQAQYF